jgi:hypothetical protein
VTITPALADGAQNFFASLYLLFADCARIAMAETDASNIRNRTGT